MKLHNQLWQEQQQDHEDCGDTRGRLYVKRIPKGWVWHCHNCGISGFKPNGDTSLDETLRYLREGKNAEDTYKDTKGRLHLPYDYSKTDIPPIATMWLDKYGITREDTQRYRFGWSEKLKRLILPLYNSEGELIYWQGRNCGKVTKDNPKYLNVRSNKNSYAVFHPTEFTDNKLCLVEDILSAVKVSRYIHAVPILGSYIGSKLLQVCKEYDTIIIWLDYDKRFESIKYSPRIRLVTGKKCNSIITKLDPKEYGNGAIKDYIET